MIPDTVLGLLLFIGALGPGIAWVIIAERRRPREQRSALVEAAELAVVGVFASGLAAMIVLAIAREWESLRIDRGQLAREGAEYLLREPVRGIGTLLAILALSLLGTVAAALIYHRKEPGVIQPGYSVWDKVFKLNEPATSVFVTAELRDGRRFSGPIAWWDVGVVEGREPDLALQAPIRVRAPGGSETPLDGTGFLVLQKPDIRWLSATWVARAFEAPAEKTPDDDAQTTNGTEKRRPT